MSQYDEANRYQPKHSKPYQSGKEQAALIMEQIWRNSNRPEYIYQPKHAKEK